MTDSLFASDAAGRGATTTVKSVADRLLALGHEVLFIAPGPGLGTYKNSRVVRVSPVAKPGAPVREALQQFRPDAVLVVSPDRLGRKALKHARKLGIHTVVVQQSPVPDALADFWVTKVALRADRVLVATAWMAERLAAIGVRSELWSPGVDTAAFSPTLRDERLHAIWARADKQPEGLVVVGYAGTLTKSHGVRHLAALNHVPGIRLVVIGDGPQRQWLRDRMPRAAFVGPLGTGDLAVAMASLDVLVHPGEQEASGHALREAAASGLPIVAPRAGAARDLVRPLETGLLYAPGDTHALAEAVAALAADPRRRMLGERGRELVLAHDWASAVDDIVARITDALTPPTADRALAAR